MNFVNGIDDVADDCGIRWRCEFVAIRGVKNDGGRRVVLRRKRRPNGVVCGLRIGAGNRKIIGGSIRRRIEITRGNQHNQPQNSHQTVMSSGSPTDPIQRTSTRFAHTEKLVVQTLPGEKLRWRAERGL